MRSVLMYFGATTPRSVDEFADEEVAASDVLRSSVEDGVVREVDGARVVDEEGDGALDWEAAFAGEARRPDDFAGGERAGVDLSVLRVEGNGLLLLAAPSEGSAGEEERVARRRVGEGPVRVGGALLLGGDARRPVQVERRVAVGDVGVDDLEVLCAPSRASPSLEGGRRGGLSSPPRPHRWRRVPVGL